ncbi:DUF1493 family protein [Marinagarivorans algicola]|uniref:DUF1493 family protein n=1 Tax=Marinagarivorans algicola TaxID=1513270 RepID=UPI0006B56B28|nr:DUF1493 family protein [Marinagarivorans algicola]
MILKDDVIDFLAEFTRIDRSKIHPHTLVNDELGVDGDDGIELLERFSEKFNVDLESLNKKYFEGEGFPLGKLFTWPLRLFSKKTSKNESCSPLKVQTLIESAERREWIDTD